MNDAKALSAAPAESAVAFEAFNLRCRTCSWRRSHIVTRVYADTLRIQHEFQHDQHVVDIEK